MTDYSNYKVLKSVINYTGDDEEKIAQAQAAQAEYNQVSDWCDQNQDYYLGDNAEYYLVLQKIPETEEQKAEYVREKRNCYLTMYVDPYVSNPLRWADMSEEEQNNIVNYRLYLLNIPEQPDFPDVEVLTFEEWSAE